MQYPRVALVPMLILLASCQGERGHRMQAPAEVRQLADDSITWKSWLEHPDAESLRQEYYMGFFAGYTESMSLGEVDPHPNPPERRMRDAFEVGKAFQIRYPDSGRGTDMRFGLTKQFQAGKFGVAACRMTVLGRYIRSPAASVNQPEHCASRQ